MGNSLKAFGAGSKECTIVSRKEWNAYNPRSDMDPHDEHAFPLKFVIVSHTASTTIPETLEECAEELRRLQIEAFHKEWSDIPFNFLVDNNGRIYEGRGSKWVPATCLGWNRKSVGIAFVGNFMEERPSEKAVTALKMFLNMLVDEGVVSNDFKLYFIAQLRERFVGLLDSELYMEVKTWKGDSSRGYNWSWQPYIDD